MAEFISQSLSPVLAQMLSEDGQFVTKENLQSLIAACDIVPTQVNMETLFRQESYCSVEYFEGWIKTHQRLASFTRWLLEEPEAGFQLEGEPDPPTFYQTLAERYGCAFSHTAVHSCIFLDTSWILCALSCILLCTLGYSCSLLQ